MDFKPLPFYQIENNGEQFLISNETNVKEWYRTFKLNNKQERIYSKWIKIKGEI